MPYHCCFPDGTFHVVRTAETGVVAQVGTVATAPTSTASRHVLKLYHATLDDIDTPANALAFLRSIYETERQPEFDRLPRLSGRVLIHIFDLFAMLQSRYESLSYVLQGLSSLSVSKFIVSLNTNKSPPLPPLLQVKPLTDPPRSHPPRIPRCTGGLYRGSIARVWLRPELFLGTSKGGDPHAAREVFHALRGRCSTRFEGDHPRHVSVLDLYKFRF
jgi:hypothetical protein